MRSRSSRCAAHPSAASGVLLSRSQPGLVNVGNPLPWTRAQDDEEHRARHARQTGIRASPTFAVIAEETGLIGIFVLISGYLVIMWRGLVIAKNAADPFGRLLAAGITFWIMLEAFINIGVMVNLLPNAGNALPFISYGGSSMLTSMAGIGILLSINRGGQQKKQEGENTFGSVVDLRWRDGRRRVSRSGHSESTR